LRVFNPYEHYIIEDGGQFPMRCLLGFIAVAVLTTSAAADPLLYEGFDYELGPLGGEVNPSNSQTWVHPTAPTPTPAQANVVDGNLNYAGLASATGDSFSLSRTANGNTSLIRIKNPGFVGTEAASVFFSFLMRVEEIVADPSNFGATAAHQNGEFFAGLTTAAGGGMTGGNVFAGMIRIRREIDESSVQTGNYELGVHKNNAGSDLTNLTWATESSLTPDSTVLVVGNYELNPAGTTDDIVRLWINPTPGEAAGTPTLEVANGGDVVTGAGAQGAINSIFFRDGAGTVTATAGIRLGPITIDEVRVGLSFADVTPVATVPVLAGDYNNDGLVDASDYVAWRKGIIQNETVSPDVVDDLDYDEWLEHFGTGEAGSGGGAVPEPASVVLCVIGIIGFLSRRDRIT
jgi:hypothetical protein